MSELTEIGIKINRAIQAVWKSELSIKELETFEAFINHQETIMPLLNPNFVQKYGFKMFDEAKERIKLLKPIIKLKDSQEGGK